MRSRLLVEKAQSLHSEGYSNAQIARILNKSTSDISRWCRKSKDIEVLQINASRQEKLRYQFFSEVSHTNSNDRALLSFLYWCEGAKYPGTNRVDFVNSDENMQLVFIKLLRKVFTKELKESKFRVMLQLHTSHDIQETTRYWSKLLSIPINQFIKPHITEGKQTRYRHKYNGTCSLRYYDYRILLKLMGSYTETSKKLLAS